MTAGGHAGVFEPSPPPRVTSRTLGPHASTSPRQPGGSPKPPLVSRLAHKAASSRASASRSAARSDPSDGDCCGGIRSQSTRDIGQRALGSPGACELAGSGLQAGEDHNYTFMPQREV